MSIFLYIRSIAISAKVLKILLERATIRERELSKLKETKSMTVRKREVLSCFSSHDFLCSIKIKIKVVRSS
ncbi:hypothetical protein BI350_04980 [Sporosarcina ureilytica]|uniref:Uncharacterized protein n=1 Tax=Sporosarcina ureilytica TaxID=298596 RepID=A0A1D8JE48_9BACL|nr:hypothetical protein BI350_04980 [Sporosarcina ureilytica]